MSNELVRPSVSCSYDVRLSDGVHVLAYTHLKVSYREEWVRQGKRGYVRMGISRSAEVSILGDCAMMGVNRSGAHKKNSVRRYNSTVTRLESGSYTESGLAEFCALPYGIQPVSFDSAGSTRVNGALLHHVQKTLLSNFEIDAVRAVIGNFRTALDVEKNADFIALCLARNWSRSVPRQSMTISRTLSSSIVERALQSST
jgi:hypothetical protein